MDKIVINGYKSIKSASVDLRNINLLIGANGSGKSNFLSLFNFIGWAYSQRLGWYVAMQGGVDKFLFQGRKITDHIDVTFVQGPNLYSVSLAESDGRFIVEHEKLSYKSDVFDIASYREELSIKDYNGLRRGDYIKEYMSQIKVFHFHDTGLKSPFAKENHVINDSYVLYPQGDNIASLLYRIKNEDSIAYKRIIKVIQSVAPYFQDFYFQPSPADMIRLQWQDRYSQNIYGPADFSDGTIRFIAMVVLFLQPVLPKVIVIDEPELGLHPFAIQKLSGLIKVAAQKGTQIIIATQDADLISNFDPEDVLTVNQNEDGTSITRLNRAQLENWLVDYSLGDLWKQNIMKGGQPK